MRMKAAVLAAFFACLLPFALAAQEKPAPRSPSSGKQHALLMFGEAKYPRGFSNFDYVNPAAPKGGRINFGYFLPFDTLNAFALKGTKAPGMYGTDNKFFDRQADMTLDTLMVASLDEAQTLYGLIAEEV
ncbi:MAG: hypothetical protein FJX23_10280, partial [Alphaproteobacteria bacterium]|nr:hypothetical protein [Alphaproteobacteria bacterium]